MPPWYVNEEEVTYLNSLSLTDTELELISQWYDGGCLLGDSTDVKIIQERPQNSAVDENYPYKDYTVFKGFKVPASDTDKYLRVSLVGVDAVDTGSLELIGIQFNPGNKNIIHHAELYAVEQTVHNDTLFIPTDYFFLEDQGAVMPGVGYRFISSWLPGQDIDYFPEGTIKTISSYESLVLLVHYGAFPKEEFDSTTVRFYTRPAIPEYKSPLKALELTVIDEYAWNPDRVFIKANEKDTITIKHTLESDTDLSIFALHPHAHLLCTSMYAILVTQEGDTSLLLDLPSWDFNWQHFYRFKSYVNAPAGSQVSFTATYDNTSRNPENPNNPPVDVYSSFRANDEMMVLFILAKEYEEGDENKRVSYPHIPLKYQ